MLINNNVNEENHVEFVSYTGKYPNLCSGILTLKIDGIEYTFGNRYKCKNAKETEYLPTFWCSGGYVGFDDDWNESVDSGEWRIDIEYIPEQFRKYASEIDYVFNENVKWGCCGGCV